MIWDRVDAGMFRVSYQTLLLSLEGAVGRAADALVTNPLRSLRTGHSEVAQLAQNGAGLQAAARIALRSAAELGAAAAGGQVQQDALAGEQGRLDALIEKLVERDITTANNLVRDQAIRYSQASRSMSAPIARLAAVSELANDSFTQLDRARRRLNSLDLADGYVRWAMAQTYLEQFIAAARAAGATQAVLTRPGEPDQVVPLDQLDPADFHPNTTAELRLP